jgi:DUF4097 and DUF4098 domain-containing protein YvlB
MRRHGAIALTAIALISLAACSGSAETNEISYTIDQPVTALKIDVRAASVRIAAADGPVTVTEKHTWSSHAPTTAHAVSGATLQLTETGCGDDNDVHCGTEYVIRIPKAMSAEITSEAGNVTIDGLAGDVHATTQAGGFEGTALTADEVIVKTEAGAASLAFITAPALVRATTQVGPVEVFVPGTEKYAVVVHSDVGPATVTVDKDPASAHHIEITTGVGPVDVGKRP